MFKLETLAGTHIREVVAEAVALAIKRKETVSFEFNGITITIDPSQSYQQGLDRAAQALGIEKILSAPEERADASARIKQQEQECEEAIAKAGVPTEADMRVADVPWPKTEEELSNYIQDLVKRPHDYGTCVYAMSMAAVAAFRYVAHELGTTGFQASCADLDIVRRTRYLKGPFMIVDAAQLLYPQYDPEEKVHEFLTSDSTTEWLHTEAEKRLKDKQGTTAHPDVLARWRLLAARKK